MPYKSEKQRKYMHAKHPKIAKKWDEKYGSKPKKKKRWIQTSSGKMRD